jgi:hypothetical protein
MPKTNREGVVSYLYVEQKDAILAKQLLEEAVQGKGVTIEEHHARIDDTFPKEFADFVGRKLVFFSTSEDERFRLGVREAIALNQKTIFPGMLRDNRGTVQNALESGMSRKKAE